MDRTKRELQKTLFSDHAASWLIQAQGFHHAGLALTKTIGLSKEPRMYSSKEMFFFKHNYKVAIYLLAHAIELLLKSIISHYNNIVCVATPLDHPQKYGHRVVKMIKELEKAGVIILDEGEEETFKLIEEYLKWFGRYYCPNEKDIEKTITESFTSSDKKEMVSFKYPPKFPETHVKIDALYRAYEPKHHGLDLLYLMYN